MLVKELDGFEETEGLVNRAANGQVIDGSRANGSLRVHDEETTEGYRVLMEDTKLGGDGLVQVSNKRKVARSQAALLAGLLGPGQMAVLRVHTDAVDLGADLAELVDAVAEGIQLRRADKGAIE